MPSIRILFFVTFLLMCSMLPAQYTGIARMDSLHAQPVATEPNPQLTLRKELLGIQAEDEINPQLGSQHRAFFCRFDDALDRKKIPLRMRLGSLEEVNTKEQKPGYRLPNPN